MNISKQPPLLRSIQSKRGLRPQYFYIILAIFLLEAVINANLGVALSVPIVLFLLVVLRSSAILAKDVPIGTVKAITVMALITLYQVPSVLA